MTDQVALAPQSSSVYAPPTPKRSARWLIPAVLLAIYVLQCGWFIRTQSLTWDEPIHINSGLQMWRQGHFAFTPDHPPMGQLLATLPLARGPWQVEQVDVPEIKIKSVTPDPQAMALRARSMNVILGVVLAALLWVTARRMFSEGAANLALGLFVFSPSLIANFSLVTTDALAALMIFVTALQLIRWRKRPSWPQTVLLGVVLGLLLLSKLSTPPLFCLTLGIVLTAKPEGWTFRPACWNWKHAVLTACIAFVVLWAGFGLHVSTFRFHHGTLEMSFPNHEPVSMRTKFPGDLTLRVPAGEYFYGIHQVTWRNNMGHSKFVLGKVSSRRLMLLQPVTVLLKWPTVVLALFTWSMVLFARKRLHRPRDLFILTAFPVGLFLLAMTSRIAIGERHILGAYPFVLLFASATWDYVRRQRRALTAVILAAGTLNAADALRFAPDYLSYFTVFVPPTQSYHLLSDSNLDWGSGLLALHEYEEQHPNEAISLAYFGSIDPAIYGIKARPLGPHERRAGTIVVSATNLSGQYLADHKAYRWLTQYPLKAVLNHSLFVYEVPPSAQPQP